MKYTHNHPNPPTSNFYFSHENDLPKNLFGNSYYTSSSREKLKAQWFQLMFVGRDFLGLATWYWKDSGQVWELDLFSLLCKRDNFIKKARPQSKGVTKKPLQLDSKLIRDSDL